MGAPKKKFDLPVKDAKRHLAIPLLQVDIDTAVKVRKKEGYKVNDKENFLSCVIAQGITRAAGADRVAIMRTVAYVAFPGEKHTKRYEISDRSRDILERFDRGEPILEGVELVLNPPTPRRQLATMRKNWHEKKAEYKPTNGQRKTDRKQSPSDPLHNVVRNGNLVRWAA